jgi:transcriptional regulator with XRE-family HTH domain
MSDVLTAPEDDLFWPPTERTEAESHCVNSMAEAWIFNFLGSRVQSFSPSPERVIVWCAAPPIVDAFALPASKRGATLCTSWPPLPRQWENSATTLYAYADVAPGVSGRTTVESGHNPPADSDERPAALGALDTSDLESAVSEIKRHLGLTDEQIQSATGVSRSTLWRLRTGRSEGARSVTEAPIWRLHSLTRALTERVGVEGVRSWLHGGDPSPAALLTSGDLEGVECAADRLVFGDETRHRSYAAVSDDDFEPQLPPPTATAMPTRRPRRARRPGDRPS